MGALPLSHIRTESTLAQTLEARAKSDPSHAFIIDRGTPLTYASLDEQSRRLAQALWDLGVRPGDRVCIWLPNVAAWMVCFFACARLGAIALALNTRFRSAEVGDLIQRSGAKTLIFSPSLIGVDYLGILRGIDPAAFASLDSVVTYLEEEAGSEPVELAGKAEYRYEDLITSPPFDDDLGDPEKGCILFTTSGTTRAPKFVQHCHRNLLRHGRDVATSFDLTRDSASLLTVPFPGVFGFCQAVAALAAGATLVMRPNFKPEEALRSIAEHRVTHIFTGDMTIERLMDAAKENDAFRNVKLSGCAIFTPGLKDFGLRAEGRGLKLVGVYGSSELQALLAHGNDHAPLEERMQMGGKPVASETSVRARDNESGRILDHGEAGELEIKAPSMALGYFGNEKAWSAAITPDGYFRTGDMGYTLADGRFVYLARLGDSLRLGGHLVSPSEIEAIIEEHPSVGQCQIVGIEVGKAWRAFAFVVGKNGTSVNEQEVIAFCASCLSKSKVPVRVHQIDAFPMTEGPNGDKIQKKKLQELAQSLI